MVLSAYWGRSSSAVQRGMLLGLSRLRCIRNSLRRGKGAKAGERPKALLISILKECGISASIFDRRCRSESDDRHTNKKPLPGKVFSARAAAELF